MYILHSIIECCGFLSNPSNLALFCTTVVPSRSIFPKKKRNSNLYLYYPKSYSFVSLYVTLNAVVVRDTSNAEMIYNAAKFVRLLSSSVTGYKEIQHMGLLHLNILMFSYRSF